MALFDKALLSAPGIAVVVVVLVVVVLILLQNTRWIEYRGAGGFNVLMTGLGSFVANVLTATS